MQQAIKQGPWLGLVNKKIQVAKASYYQQGQQRKLNEKVARPRLANFKKLWNHLYHCSGTSSTRTLSAYFLKLVCGDEKKLSNNTNTFCTCVISRHLEIDYHTWLSLHYSGSEHENQSKTNIFDKLVNYKYKNDWVSYTNKKKYVDTSLILILANRCCTATQQEWYSK